MKRHISTILCFIFLTAIMVSTIVYNVTKPRIMILHSYQPDYAWTRDINIGLHRVMDNWNNCTIFWHYMDTKNHPDQKWLDRAGILARRSVEKNDPDVLIAIDDLAQELAGKYFINHQQMNIVFAGVNASVEPYGYLNAHNVTGIYERKVLRAVKEMIMALNQDSKAKILTPKLFYIMDPSASLQTERSYIDHYDWDPIQYRGSIIAENFTQWRQIVRENPTKADYLLVANYRKLPKSRQDPRLSNPHEVMTWTEKYSPIPVIGINSFNVEDGAMLSIGASPYEQGEVAAQLTQKILRNHRKASDFPIVDNQQYIVALKKSLLDQRQLHLPSIYEAFGRATGHYHTD